MRKLNLGCGEVYKEGWINVDSREGIRSDMVWDLNKTPYPFNDNTFELILMESVLEHLNDPIKVLKEIIRIGKKGGKIVVLVPHSNYYAATTDIQHKTFFTENSFDKQLLKEYELEELKLIGVSFFYGHGWKKFIPFKKFLKIFFNGVYDNIIFKFQIEK